MTLNTEKYSWEITDKHGWELDESHKREFEINSLLHSDDINKLVESIDSFCTLRLTYNKSTLAPKKLAIPPVFDIDDIRYIDNHLEVHRIKFFMDFSDTDDFIEKLLEDNGWEISKKVKFMRKKINL